MEYLDSVSELEKIRKVDEEWVPGLQDMRASFTSTVNTVRRSSMSSVGMMPSSMFSREDSAHSQYQQDHNHNPSSNGLPATNLSPTVSTNKGTKQQVKTMFPNPEQNDINDKL